MSPMAPLAGTGSLNGRVVLPPPPFPGNALPPAFATGQTLNAASTVKYGVSGRLAWSDGGTHSIRKVHARAGSVTAGSGSTFRVSLQDPATATTPIQPDGGVDETYTTTTMPTANAWWTSGNLSADRSVAHGGLISVVFELSVFGSSTSVIVQCLSTASGVYDNLNASQAYSASAWTTSSTGQPNVLFEAADGTFGTLDGCMILSAINTHAHNSGSNPKVHALEFTLPVPMVVDGAWFLALLAGSTATVDAKIYDAAGNVVVSTTINPYQLGANTSARFWGVPFAPTTLDAGKVYRLALVPTSANNITVYSFDVAAAAHMAVNPMGAAFVYNTLSSGNAWGTATTTRRLLAGLRIAKIGMMGGD